MSPWAFIFFFICGTDFSKKEHLEPNVLLNCGPVSLTPQTACSFQCASPALPLPPALLHPDSLSWGPPSGCGAVFRHNAESWRYLGVRIPCGSALRWPGQVCGSLDSLTLVRTHSQASLCRISLNLGLYMKSCPSICFLPLLSCSPLLSRQFLKGEIV